MCGRFAAAKDTATLVDEFQIETVVEPAPEPSFNVAPTDQVAFVVDRPVADPGDEAEHLQRQLRTARWGLVPSWAKDPKIGSRMINARWENAAGKAAFRAAFAKRRCLIPADGYFEWYTPQSGSGSGAGASLSAEGQRPGPGKPRKQPYFIHRADGAPLALAGLYEFWRPSPEGEWLVTVTVLTCASSGPMAALHDRMPVVIDPSGYTTWLDPGASVGEDFDTRLAVDLLAVYPVSAAVNSVRNNSPDLLDPIPAEPIGDPSPTRGLAADAPVPDASS